MTRSALAALVVTLVPAAALAHGGGLDANGCHTNRKTGEYHCHRAPAPSSSSGSVRTPLRAPSASPSTSTPLYSQSQPATPLGIAVQGLATERQLVLTAQLLLMALGYSPGKPDGMLTDATTGAVKQFQADRSLDQDGLVKGSLLVRLAEQAALRAKAS